MSFSGGTQGRPGAGAGRGAGSSNKSKVRFRRYSLPALSCYRQNSVLSPLKKWPQLSPVRHCEGGSQYRMVRTLFPKDTELWKILLLSKAPNFKRRQQQGDHHPFRQGPHLPTVFFIEANSFTHTFMNQVSKWGRTFLEVKCRQLGCD